MDDRQALVVPQRFEGRQRGVQAELAVEVNDRSLAFSRTRQGESGPQAVVAVIGVGHDHVQAVNGAALEKRHEDFLVALGFERSRALQERRRLRGGD